jgi:hypothetical protein
MLDPVLGATARQRQRQQLVGVVRPTVVLNLGAWNAHDLDGRRSLHHHRKPQPRAESSEHCHEEFVRIHLVAMLPVDPQKAAAHAAAD